MPAPDRLGRYPVLGRLGAGAFATVWLAHDDHLDSDVAVKVLADNWSGDLHVRQRFLEEGRFLRRVTSPHVIPVYDAGELEDGRPYLVMAHADRGTLADRLEGGAGVPPDEAIDVVCQIGDGLTALHAHGVLHRDVKPGNVLFRTVQQGGGPTVLAMVGDLGLGKAMDMSSRLTMIGGTPSYVAPEQARGEGLDARADEFSLAALSYLLLAGRPPYAHQTLGAAVQPGPPDPMGGGVPAEVEAVVRRGLAADREDRYPDVEAFTAALRTAWAGNSSGAQVARSATPGEQPALAEAATALIEWSEEPPPRRRRLPWILGGAVALGVGGLIGVLAQPALAGDETVYDSSGTISVRVPDSWTTSVQPGAWTPPGASTDYPAVSAGSAQGWQAEESAAPGVFAGLIAGDRLPTELPRHPECQSARDPVSNEQDGDTSVTVVHTDCPGPDVVVERVVQVSEGQLLWVQVRSDDQPTANRVLDGVELHGY